jgi:hypothetical protein
MCDFINNTEWLKVIQTIASVAVALIAWRALENWKIQSKAAKKSDFIDELTDVAHEFIYNLHRAITILKFTKQEIEFHEDVLGEYSNAINPNLASFIENNGRERGKRIFESLESCQQALARMRSLEARGQIYGFERYHECQNACRMLAWQNDRIEAFAAMISLSHSNWQNQKLDEKLKEVLKLDPSDIEDDIKEYNMKLLSFAITYHKRTYEMAELGGADNDEAPPHRV